MSFEQEFGFLSFGRIMEGKNLPTKSGTSNIWQMLCITNNTNKSQQRITATILKSFIFVLHCQSTTFNFSQGYQTVKQHSYKHKISCNSKRQMDNQAQQCSGSGNGEGHDCHCHCHCHYCQQNSRVLSSGNSRSRQHNVPLLAVSCLLLLLLHTTGGRLAHSADAFSTAPSFLLTRSQHVMETSRKVQQCQVRSSTTTTTTTLFAVKFDDFSEGDVGLDGVVIDDLNWRIDKLRLEEENKKRFLKAKPRFLPYAECCKWAQAFGRWNSQEEWEDWVSMGEKRNAYIPSRPDEYYGRLGQWISWVRCSCSCSCSSFKLSA